MSFLDKYKALDVDRLVGPDALDRAKRKIINALNQQIENIKNPGQVNGHGKPVREWSFRDNDGKLHTHIRFGTRPMEFPTGKAFAIDSADGLIPFYSDVVSAVEAGELDDIINNSRKVGARGHGKRKGRGGRHGGGGPRGSRGRGGD